MPSGPNASSVRVARGARRPDGLLLLLGGLAALGPVGLDIFFPALPALTDEFGVGASVAQLTIALFVVGLAIGQLFAGPLSDIYGRRGPLVASTALYAAASAVCALAPSIALLAGARLIQGLVAAAGIAIGRAVVRDLYSGTASARFLSSMIVVYGASPIVAPIVGGQILRFADWRSVFVVAALFGAIVTAATVRGLPETLPPERRRSGSIRATFAGFGVLIGDRAYVGYALAHGLASGAVFVYAGMAPYVLQDLYGLSAQTYAVVFASSALAMVGAAYLNSRLVGRFAPARLLVASLALAIVAGAGLLACALLAAPLWPAVAFMLVLMISWGPTQANALALGLAGHPERAGSASALLGLLQYGTGAIAIPLVGLGGRATLLPMALAVTALSLAALAALRLTGPRPRLAPPLTGAERRARRGAR